MLGVYTIAHLEAWRLGFSVAHLARDGEMDKKVEAAMSCKVQGLGSLVTW